jgi:hypothetical protein
MKTHFEMSINYDNRVVKVNVQCVSNELPQIKYVVWTDDKEINTKLMSNVKQVYFKIASIIDENNSLQIINKVSYDYIDNQKIYTDVVFEFGIWNALFNY